MTTLEWQVSRTQNGKQYSVREVPLHNPLVTQNKGQRVGSGHKTLSLLETSVGGGCTTPSSLKMRVGELVWGKNKVDEKGFPPHHILCLFVRGKHLYRN